MFYLGLHSIHQSLFVVLAEWKNGGMHVKSLREFPLQELTSDVKLLDILRPLYENNPLWKIAAIRSEDSLIKFYDVPSRNRVFVEKALNEWLTGDLPLPLEQCEKQVLFKRQKSSSEALSFLVSKDALQTLFSQYETYGIALDETSLEPQALWRFSKEKYVLLPNTLVFYFEPFRTVIVEVVEGYLARFWTLSRGLQRVLEEKELHSRFDSAIDFPFCAEDPLKKDLESFSRFLDQETSPKEKGVLVLNDQGILKSFIETTFHRLSVESLPHKGASHSPFAIAYGLCLEAASRDKQRLSFGQERLKSRGRRFWSRTLSLFSLSAVISLGIVAAGYAWKGHLEAQLIGEQNLLLSQFHHDSSLSLDENFFYLESALKKKALRQQWIPAVPSVENIMSHVQSLLEKTSIRLHSLHYDMKQFPTRENPRNPYLLTIEIRLSTDEPPKIASFSQGLQEVLESSSIEYHYTPDHLWEVRILCER